MLLSINQVTKQTGLTGHTLRYYERIGLISCVSRDSSGKRCYHSADMAWLDFLLRLRKTHMPIQKMLEFAQLRSLGDKTVSERRQLLEHHLQQLLIEIETLQQSAQELQIKIAHYKTLEQEQS